MKNDISQQCKEFLVAHVKEKHDVDTTASEFKRLRKYKVDSVWHRDFSHPQLSDMSIKENNGVFEVINDFPTMAQMFEGMRDTWGSKLTNNSVENTFAEHVDEPFELVNSEATTDDAGNPVMGYYYECDRRDYTLLVYPDNSWIMSSD